MATTLVSLWGGDTRVGKEEPIPGGEPDSQIQTGQINLRFSEQESPPELLPGQHRDTHDFGLEVRHEQ